MTAAPTSTFSAARRSGWATPIRTPIPAQIAEPNAALYDTVSGNSVNFSGGAGGGALLFSRSTNLVYRGNINGNLSVTQSGSNLLLLSGSNSYTGATNVNSGTLIAAGASALGSGAVTVAGGATLDYRPTVAGPLDLTP